MRGGRGFHVSSGVRGDSYAGMAGHGRGSRDGNLACGHGTYVELDEHPKRRDKSSGKDLDDTATGIKMPSSSPYHAQAN
jgi:hypothetical protein